MPGALRIKYPKGLQESGRRLWKSVLEEFELEPHEELQLLQACRTADRLDALAGAAEGAALTVRNAKGDEVANPLLVESRQQSIVYARLIAALRLPNESDQRPQHRGVRGAYGVQSRPMAAAS